MAIEGTIQGEASLGIIKVIVPRTGRHREQYLMIANRGHGGFGLVGGKREREDATPKHTLIREIGEELGIVSVNPEELAIVHQGTGAVTDRWVHIFHVAYLAAEPPRVGASGEEVRYVTFEELCETPPFGAYYRDNFPDGWRHLRETAFQWASRT
jgi:8-oxo-dGTP pyrophosphatase MutT (NUDIX family)